MQVTGRDSTTRNIERSTVDKWLESIGWMDNMEKVRVAVVPQSGLAENLKTVYDGDDIGYPPLEVWKVPSDYGLSF